MDRTIDERATEFAEREYEVGEIDRDALRKGYYWGVKDTTFLPLASRLNNGERELIRMLYEEIFRTPNKIDATYCRKCLKRIFGLGLFFNLNELNDEQILFLKNKIKPPLVSTRVSKVLVREYGLETFGDLLEVLKGYGNIPYSSNFGNKSRTEINDLFASYGISINI